MSYETSVNGIPYTSYDEKAIFDITDSGLIVVDRMKFDSDSGLECECRLHRRRHIVMLDDELALRLMEEHEKAKKIYDVILRMHSCQEWNLNYEQAISIAMIMGWKV